MILLLLIIAAGFLFLMKGADWLIDGVTALAKRYKISDLAVGLVIVAFGTSLPELVVNIFASWNNHNGIVFGNIIGSNNFNIFLVLGVTGLITPLAVQSRTVSKEIPFLFISIVVLYVLANMAFFGDKAGLSRIDGLILLILFVMFFWYVATQLKQRKAPVPAGTKLMKPLKMWLFIIAGLIMLIIGGRFIVNAAVEIAEIMGVSQNVIGLTVVAAGTSLPELAASIAAAMKKKADIMIGNIVGSNIFNFFLIGGVSALVRPLTYDVSFNNELYFLTLGTILLFVFMFSGQKLKLDRWEAIILLLLFVSYTVYLIIGGR